MQHHMRWHCPSRQRHHETQRLLLARVRRDVAQGAYSGGVRRDDEAVSPAADPGFGGGGGEGDVREACEEEDVSVWAVSGG
jgi:hypothetical protein